MRSSNVEEFGTFEKYFLAFFLAARTKTARERPKSRISRIESRIFKVCIEINVAQLRFIFQERW